MEGSRTQAGRRTLTPAVLLSAAFLAACAVFAVSFVAGRGGLQMPVAATNPPVAVASEAPSELPSVRPTTVPTIAPPSPTVTEPPPTLPPTAPPTVGPTVVPTLAIPTLRPNDPLAALPTCPDFPGCYVYIVQRGDSLTTIADKFLVGTITILALNPQITDPSIVVTNTPIYLGLSPFLRLDPCPGGEACWIYVVRPGDSLAGIAARYGLTTDQVLAANPGLPRPLTVGQEVRLPD